MRHFALCGFVLVCFMALLWSCNTSNQKKSVVHRRLAPSYASLDGNVNYVGKEACAGCHPSEYAGFMQNGMGKSFDSATKIKSAGIFNSHVDVFDRYSDMHYHPFWQNNKMCMLEYRVIGGDTVHKRIQQIDYIIGSGHHTNSHFTRINGYLYQAPLTFYTQKKQWDLPPGFEKGNNTRFSRAILAECITCHNAYPKLAEASDNKYLSLPHGIDCERCHGPGEAHVKDKQAGNLVNINKQIDYTIVNPGKLPWPKQISVCQRCHLQGNAVLKPGKTFFDFKPGQNLKEVMDVYLPRHEGGENKFIMASHADRMLLSQCFRKSNGKLTCISCHNPHKPVEAINFNAKCLNCHASQTHAAVKHQAIDLKANCIACHMPKSGTIDIPHVTVTDHFIRKNTNQAKAEKALGKFIGLVAINNASPTPLSKANAYVQYYEKFDRKMEYIDSARKYFLQISNQDGSWFDAGVHIAFAAKNWQQVLEMGNRQPALANAANAWTAYRIAEAATALGNDKQAGIYLTRAVGMAPFNVEFKNKLGAWKTKLGDVAGAKAIFESILQAQPQHSQAMSNLAYLFLVEGQPEKAKALLDKALLLDPDYAQARVNLAGYYAALGNMAMAQSQLKRVLKKEPANASARQALQRIKG